MKTVTANKTVRAAAVLVGLLGLMTMSVSAMHIAEGMLPVPWAIGWGAVCVPFLVAGFFSIKKKIDQAPRAKILLAMCGAFAFVLSALKIPSVSGSCSHPTGVGLGAILFGPLVMTVLGLIVLLFQALLLAHGGLTTLGANTFSMAVAGPFVSAGVYALLKKLRVHRLVAVGLACALGDLFTYCVTSVQLAWAQPGSLSFGAALAEYMGIFAVTQIPLAVVEGVLSAIVVMLLESFAKPELREIGFLAKEGVKS